MFASPPNAGQQICRLARTRCLAGKVARMRQMICGPGVSPHLCRCRDQALRRKSRRTAMLDTRPLAHHPAVVQIRSENGCTQ